MAIRIVAILLALLGNLAAQRPPAHAKASDYTAHSKLASLEIGASYLPHGIPGNTEFTGREYIVVEVAVFPLAKDVAVSKSQFTLRVDGERALQAVSIGSAQSASIAAGSSSKDSSIVLGGPPLTSHSSGVVRDRGPRAPIELDSEESSSQRPSASAGFPEGALTRPAASYLLFRMEGEAKPLRSLELNYDGGPMRKTKLRLF